MIFNALFFIIKSILDILLAPLNLINIGIDFLASFPIVARFLGIVTYILPMNYLMPLFHLIIAMFFFRAVISLIKTIWALLPFA